MSDVAMIRAKCEALRPFLDERQRRLWAATEAQALGRGGVSAVAIATGLRRNTIHAGLRELQAGAGGGPARPRGRGPPAGCGRRAGDASR